MLQQSMLGIDRQGPGRRARSRRFPTDQLGDERQPFQREFQVLVFIGAPVLLFRLLQHPVEIDAPALERVGANLVDDREDSRVFPQSLDITELAVVKLRIWVGSPPSAHGIARDSVMLRELVHRSGDLERPQTRLVFLRGGPFALRGIITHAPSPRAAHPCRESRASCQTRT